jgi:uncharacterized membrane protein
MNPHYSSGSGTKASIGGHPIHPMLVPLPMGFLAGALISDIVFLVNSEPFWAQASYWLIVGGLITGVMASLVGLVEILGVKRAKKNGYGVGAWSGKFNRFGHFRGESLRAS